MTRYLKIHFICILCLIFSAPASSELYQYKDKNGITRITNDIYSVPVAERPQLEKYSEIKSIGNDMEIQPLKNKTLPKPKTDKTLPPKTPKATTAETGKTSKTVMVPKTTKTPKTTETGRKTVQAPEKQPASPPKPIVSKPVGSEKKVQKPVPVKTGSFSYKSKKIIIVKPALEKKSANESSAKPLTEKITPGNTIQDKNNHAKSLQPQIGNHPVEKIAKKEIIPDKKPAVTITAKAEKKQGPKPATVKPEKTLAEVKPEPEQKTHLKGTVETETKQAAKIVKKESLPEKQPVIIPATELVEKQAPKPVIAKSADTVTEVETESAQKAPLKSTIPSENKPLKKPVDTQPVEKVITSKTVSQMKSPSEPPKNRHKKQAVEHKKTEPNINAMAPAPEKSAVEMQFAAAPQQKPEIKPANAPTGEPAGITDQKQETRPAPIGSATPPTSKPETAIKTAKAEIGNATPLLPDQKAFKRVPAVKAAAGSGLTEPAPEKASSPATEKDDSLVMAKLETTQDQLRQKKDALNKKFLSLMEEKEKIEASVNEDDEKSVLEYNENVKKLNIKIKQYKKGKKALQAEIDDYNNAIRQLKQN